MIKKSLISKYLAASISCILTILSASCADDVFNQDSVIGERMGFKVSVHSGNGNTRTSSHSETFDVDRFGDSDLYLFSIDSNESDTRSTFSSHSTRALPIESMDAFKKAYTSFALYTWTISANNEISVYTQNEEITPIHAEEGDWVAESNQVWPGDEYQMNILAVAPYSSNSDDYMFSNNDNDQTLEFSYTVPSDSKDQKDILVASQHVSKAGNSSKYLDLQFHHILTAVKIKGFDLLQRKLKKVTLQGVTKSGECVFTSGMTEFIWDLKSNSKSDFSYEYDIQLGQDTTMIIDNEATFMMIPQDVENVTLVAEFEDGSSIKGELHGNWTAGHSVTYVISP